MGTSPAVGAIATLLVMGGALCQELSHGQAARSPEERSPCKEQGCEEFDVYDGSTIIRSWISDGECDVLCNVPECNWDGTDCFHDHSECYRDPRGADYFGKVNVTKSGRPCQIWDNQYPQSHRYEAKDWPNAGLGGHNFCRNLDEAQSGGYASSPWCLLDLEPGQLNDGEERWEYCDVGPQSREPCPPSKYPPPPSIEKLDLRMMLRAEVGEHLYNYYAIELNASTVPGVQVVLFPLAGDPDMYISFTETMPNGHNFDYKQDGTAVEEFFMKRDMYGFCGNNQAESNNDKCTLYVGVTSYDEPAVYEFVVFPSASHGDDLCAPTCEWSALGDGQCQLACNTTACGFDRGDCLYDTHGCKVDCKPQWLGDGYCDEACYNEMCGWDQDDCGGPACSEGCHPKYLNDGECDEECNNPACNWDVDDCFHDHGECYSDPKGSDYRGIVSHSISGVECQAWSQQQPQAHTYSTERYPKGGLGGHNYCRNPDGTEAPWCYLAAHNKRWEICDVGPHASSCTSPPSPPPRRAPRPPPPSPSPPPTPPSSPPELCPGSCPKTKSDADGVCNSLCNTSVCLWDMGDCGEISQADIGSADTSHFGSLQNIAAIITGVSMHAAMRAGIAVGVAATAGACCLFFFCRRYKKKMIKKPARAYMAYGETDGPVDACDSANEIGDGTEISTKA